MISMWVVPGPNFKHIHKSKSKLVSISWGTIVHSGEQTISKKVGTRPAPRAGYCFWGMIILLLGLNGTTNFKKVGTCPALRAGSKWKKIFYVLFQG